MGSTHCVLRFNFLGFLMKTPEIDQNYMLIGRVLRPHGVRGEIRAEILTSVPEYFDAEQLYLGRRPTQLKPYEVEDVRFHQEKALVKFVDIDDREVADGLRDLWVYIDREDALPLEEGEFYLYQLIGMSVVTDEGEALGKVTDTLQTGANDVFVVNGARGEILLPDIEGVVLSVDGEQGLITVHLIEGLI